MPVHDLLDFAAQAGMTVTTARLPEGMLGCYLPACSTICLDTGLTPAERRSVLAHELGHVHYGHACSDPPAGVPALRAVAAQERQADAFAARLVIDPAEYARLERIDPDADAIADELGVTVDLIEAYRRHCLTRVRGGVHALPRLRLAQWGHRDAGALP